MMREAGLLAMWTWGSAGMLAWALAAAIPLAIHWWSRRRFQETPWAAMEFLLAALRRNARRLRLEQYLLLSLRMGALGLFALALADPLVTRGTSGSPATAPRHAHWIVVLDTSYSMAFRSRDRSRLEMARDAVARWLEQAGSGDAFSLVLMQDPPRAIGMDPSFDRESLRREVERQVVSHSGADLAATLRLVERVADRARERYPQLGSVRTGWFTDLGASTWGGASGAGIRELSRRLADKAELSLWDVGSEGGPNLAVTAIRRERSAVTAGDSLAISADLRAFGAPGPGSVRVEFLLDGSVVRVQDVRVPVEGSVTASALVSFDSAGESVVEVRVPPDPLLLDNQRWMVVPVRKSLKVLCVQGEPEAGEFVALALNPTRSVAAPMHAEVVTEGALLDRSLDPYDCVMLNNVARVGYGEAEALHRYVAGGGGLIVVLGDLVQGDNYNRELGDEAGERRLLPAAIGPVVRGGERFLDPIDYGHPLTAPFRGHERSGLLTVPSWRYFRLRPRSSPEVQTAIRFDNGDAAIVGEAIGRGHCVLVATALSPSSSDATAEGRVPWSALPAWPSFPPLVHGLVRWAVEGQAAEREQTVGSPLEIVSRQAAGAAADVKLPDGSIERVSCSLVDGVRRGTFAGTRLQGVYEVAFAGEGAVPPNRFAVNSDPRESDPARIAREAIPSAFAASAEPLRTGEPHSHPRHVPVFRWLLAGVVFLLVGESAVACWCARRGI